MKKNHFCPHVPVINNIQWQVLLNIIHVQKCTCIICTIIIIIIIIIIQKKTSWSIVGLDYVYNTDMKGKY